MPSRNEKENYNCIMEIINVAVCEGLRKIFKQEWDKRYGISKGVWDDSPLTGNELYNMERKRKEAGPYLHLFKAGKRSDWDCSAVSDAILHSNAITKHPTALSPHVYNKADELRDLRNILIHSFGSQSKMSDDSFENAYTKVKNCFNVLSLSTTDVERIRNSWKANLASRSWGMRYICLKIFLVGLLSSVIYYQVIKSTQDKALFRVLPARPTHLVAKRSRTVATILQELQHVSDRNNQSLTYLYISGNLGSGTSQLARLVGEQYGAATSHSRWFGATTFVMTLNGCSLRHILSSYVEFAHRLDCNHNNITNILNSDDTVTAVKIERLQTEIAKALKTFKNKFTWLLIVDNVVNLSKITSFLPHLQDEDWQGGQLLIATQDKSSVPPNSSLTVHISVSEGMDPAECCEFLDDLSGFIGNHDVVNEVAKNLDYQPLALASAAYYVKNLRQSKISPQFSWNDYLKKLGEGKHNLSERKISDLHPDYSLTMYTAVLLSVSEIAESDPVLRHAFTFLSYVSHEPLSLYLLESYVLRVDSSAQNVKSRIRQCFFILSSDDNKVASISLHRVAHDSIKLYIADDLADGTNSPLPFTMLQMLIQLKFHITVKALIPHLEAFYIRTKNLTMVIPTSTEVKQEVYSRLLYLARVLEEEYDESFLARHYRALGFTIFSKID